MLASKGSLVVVVVKAMERETGAASEVMVDKMWRCEGSGGGCEAEAVAEAVATAV